MFDKFEVWAENFLEASLSCFLALVMDMLSSIFQIIAHLQVGRQGISSPHDLLCGKLTKCWGASDGLDSCC